MGIATAVLWNVPPRRSIAAQIEREFSGVWAWFGQATGEWWALVRLHGGARLVEAGSADDLRRAILNARGWR